ncbi:GIY-YIG nuclease family protein [Chlorogloea sp. CCALA 695]|uniref:GIY-YIG nuclease family protein n=1 Tax=Chlorogloea sp. CCALA 695 TaxID=2107693 RepID=UPI000D048592|nr:GIY-YIG nuclease family protein [Chlorogloea sp. CCALA 695]PSB32255.1 hypothetical protein C7B70_10845 [Chlorogloea sp. CCALA 695]
MSALAPESFDFSSLPSLPLSDKGKLPNCAAVYFALSSHRRILYIGRSINIRERLRGHHRLALLKSFADVRIAWLTESDSLALRRIETILIEYFNPPLNKIPSYLKAEDTKKLVEYLTLNDRASAAASNRTPKNNVIPINKFLTSQSQTKEFFNQVETENRLDSPFEQKLSLSDFKEVTLGQEKRINHLEDKIAALQLMFEKQMQVHCQLTETLVEQAKTISELSRTQAETNSRLVEVTVEQALTISQLSSALQKFTTEAKP